MRSIADSPYHDAEQVARYAELPVVVDPLKARAVRPSFTPISHDVAFTMPVKVGDPDKAFADADETIKVRIVNQRLAPVPIETRAMVASWDTGMQQLTLYSATQIPHLLRTQLAVVLGLSENRIRAIAPEVGGGFGAKLNVYAEEAVICWAAMQLERPVKYSETRSECFEAMIHGRDQVDDLEIACKRDGTITGMRLKITANLGAYHQLLTPVIRLSLDGARRYRIANIDAVRRRVTNTMSTDASRGATPKQRS